MVLSVGEYYLDVNQDNYMFRRGTVYRSDGTFDSFDTGKMEDDTE